MKKIIILIIALLIFCVMPDARAEFSGNLTEVTTADPAQAGNDAGAQEAAQKDAAGELPQSSTEEPQLNTVSATGAGEEGSTASYSSSPSNILSSFQADPYTGKATFVVPIQVPAGRRGLQPALSLVYQSQGPNTWCGLGWMLDTGSIQRSTKKGAPKYDNTDTFVLNFNGSAQELVNTNGIEYRMKLESGFMRFQFNQTNWVVTDSKGTKYYYGQTDNSRQKKNSTDTYSWHLDKAIDNLGNYLLITYQSDQNKIYPARISYTGNEILGDVPKYSVEFALEDRPDVIINCTSGIKTVTAKRLSRIDVKYDTSLVRQYKISYQPKTDTRFFSLISQVQLYGSDGISNLSPVSFEYYDNKPAFDSASIQWANINNNGYDWWYWWAIRACNANGGKYFLTDIVDVNADGLPDRIMCPHTAPFDHFHVQLNNGTSFDNPIDVPISYDATREQLLHYTQIEGLIYPITKNDFLDINSDGLPDRVSLNDADHTKWKVWFNKGGSFDAASTTWTNINYNGNDWWYWRAIRASNSNKGIQSSLTEIMDINADGLPDRIMRPNNAPFDHFHVQLNNRTGFDDPIDVPISYDHTREQLLRYSQVWGSIYPITYNDFFDINADGLPDRVSVNETDHTKWKVWFNKGCSFESASTTWPNINYDGNDSPYWYGIRSYNANGVQSSLADIADINGDGLPDRILRPNNAPFDHFHVQLNNGTGFENPIDVPISYDSSREQLLYYTKTEGEIYPITKNDFLDINGDGLPDRVSMHDTDHTKWKVWFNSLVAPNCLKKISNGIGGEIAITYKAYKGADNKDPAKRSKLPFPLWVVDKITTTEAVSGDSFNTSYSYDSGIFDFASRESRGFGYIKVTDHEGNFSEKYFYQDDIYKGKPYQQKSYDSNGTLLAQTQTTYQDQALYNGAVILPYASQADSYSYDGGAAKHTRQTTQYVFNNDLVDQTTVIQEGDVDDPDDNKSAVTKFSHNTVDWLIALPYESESKDSSGATVSNRRVYYDGSTSLGAYPVKGLATKQAVWLNLPQGKWLATTVEYDSYGNVKKTTDPKNNSIETTYDATLHQYPVTIKNALNQTQQFTYDYKTGQALTAKDLNSKTTTKVYDSLGRPKEIYGPKDTDGYASVICEYDLSAIPSKITQKVKTDYGAANYLTTYTFSDGFGRTIQVRSPAEPDGVTQRQVVSGAAIYDYNGKVKESYRNYFEGYSASYSAPAYSAAKTTYDYDALGRTIKITAQKEDGSPIYAENAYSGWTTTSTDFNGNKKDTYCDAYGNTIRVTEYNEGNTYNTYYAYDSLGNLKEVKDTLGNETTLTYDSLSRKLSMSDPNMGNWSYAYDDNSNITSQTDAKGQKATFAYDALNRLVCRTTSEGATVTYSYDQGTNGIGCLNRVDYYGGYTEFYHDEIGRETKSIKSIDSSVYTVERTYDALDRIRTLKYPDNEMLTYTYGVSGAVTKIQGLTKTYVSSIEYNVFGQMTKVIYGNNTFTAYSYNEYTQRLDSLLTKGPSGAIIQHLGYQFDNAGNVKSIIDAKNTASQAFEYDDLYRLKRAQNPTGYGTLDFAYDPIGNMTQKGNMILQYPSSGPGAVRPHAVSSLRTSQTNETVSITYDANGNMLSKGNITYKYDSENHLKKVTKPDSVISGTYNIELKAGWNFLSLPCVPTGYSASSAIPISTALSSISGKYSQVTRYNTSTGKYESYAGNSQYDRFNTLEYLKGYQIYCDAACTLTITGSSPSSAYSLQLSTGNNLVGVDITNNGKSASAAFSGISYSSIKWYNPNTKAIETIGSGDTVYMGRSYWLNVTSASAYSVTALTYITSFGYDGDGGRIKKTVDGVTTIYVGPLFEKTSGITTRHIYLGASRICSVSAAGGMSFYHGDHLGSTGDITDQNGNLMQHTEYKPYGEFSPTSATFGDTTDCLFTGQLFDKSTNLYYYNARYYDPELGRFITPDIMVQAPYDAQSLNRYGYCHNNPIIYSDPTGHFWFLAAVIVGAVLGGVSAGINGQPIWEGVLKGAIGGALVSCGGAAFGVWGAVAGGAIAGAGNAAVSGGNIGFGALVGGVGAGLGFGLGQWAGGWNSGSFWGELAASAFAGAIAGGLGSELSGGSFGEGAWMGAAYGTAGFIGAKAVNQMDPTYRTEQKNKQVLKAKHNMCIKRNDMIKIHVSSRGVFWFAKHQFLTPLHEMGPDPSVGGAIRTTNKVEDLKGWGTYQKTQSSTDVRTTTVEVSFSGLVESIEMYNSSWVDQNIHYNAFNCNSNYAINTIIYAAGGNVAQGIGYCPSFSNVPSSTLYLPPVRGE